MLGALALKRLRDARGVEAAAFDAVAQGFSALVEGRLDDPHEVRVADAMGEGGDVVAHESDDAALDLGRWVEGVLVHGEQVVDVVVRLQQHAQDAVGLGAWSLGHALGDFLLEHPHTFGHAVAPVQHPEEDLGADVVREVARHNEGGAVWERLTRVPLEQVDAKDVFRRQHALARQIEHGLVVQLHHLDPQVSAVQERTRQGACSRPDFEHVDAPLMFGDAQGDPSGGVQVAQEMLP